MTPAAPEPSTTCEHTHSGLECWRCSSDGIGYPPITRPQRQCTPAAVSSCSRWSNTDLAIRPLRWSHARQIPNPDWTAVRRWYKSGGQDDAVLGRTPQTTGPAYALPGAQDHPGTTSMAGDAAIAMASDVKKLHRSSQNANTHGSGLSPGSIQSLKFDVPSSTASTLDSFQVTPWRCQLEHILRARTWY